MVGKLKVTAQYQHQPVKELPLVVVRGSKPCLLGRSWLKHFRLHWPTIAAVSVEERCGYRLSKLLKQYQEVFSEELWTIFPFEARLSVCENAKPKFCKYRSVPYAIRGVVEEELERLENVGVLEKVSHSDWHP